MALCCLLAVPAGLQAGVPDASTILANYERALRSGGPADGRSVYESEVRAPHGEPETLSIDRQTWLVDRVEYIDGDGFITIDFADYRRVDGLMTSFRSVESDGDHAFDITRTTAKIRANQALPSNVFTPLSGPYIDVDKPVAVPIVERDGHIFTSVRCMSIIICS